MTRHSGPGRTRGCEAGASAPGWWTSDSSAHGRDPAFAAGEANFGMAHGVAGPLALLALAMRRGVVVEERAAAIDRTVRWLDVWQHPAAARPWWPERITADELRTGCRAGAAVAPRSNVGGGRPAFSYRAAALWLRLRSAG